MTLDTLRLFPNQSTELRPDECAGETVADIMGNMYGIQMDAGFAYAVARTLAQSPSTIGGVDLYNTMVGAVIYGSLPYEIPRGEPDKVEPTDVREPIECLSKTMNDDEGREESDHIEPTDDREDEKVLPRESSSLPFQEVIRKDHPL